MGYDGRVQHLVIGAGFAGLCAAIKLQEDGERDFLVVEKGPDVGGTWRDNTYPGAACDVPSQLYSFSFAHQPRLVELLLAPAGDPGLPPEGGDAGRDARPVRLRHHRRRRHVGRRPTAVAQPARRTGRRTHGHLDDAARRRRRPVRAEAARHRRDRRLPGRGLPLRPLEPRRRPHRQAGRGDRHRRVGDPDRPRAAEGRRPPRRLPAHRAVRDPAQRPHVRRLRAARAHAGCPRCAGSTAPASTGRTRPTCPASRSSRSSPCPPRSWRWPTSARGSRTRSCGRR